MPRRIPGSSAIWRSGSARASTSPYAATREIFDELREASRGGIADYYGITYEKIDEQMGVFWPCPSARSSRHAAPVRGRQSPIIPTASAASTSPSGGRAAIRWMRSFPIYLTTGRVVSQYLSGTQTRRIGALVDIYPEPHVEIHPRLAEKYRHPDQRLGDGENRGAIEITLQARSCKTIRPDTVFIPYHWPNERSANRLTHRTLDPRSKIPEFKVSACRLSKALRAPRGLARPKWRKRNAVR